MFIGLARVKKRENVEIKIFKLSVSVKKTKNVIRSYQLDAENVKALKNEHLNDLQSYKEDFCSDRGVWSDLDYEGHEITGYANESSFVETLMDLFEASKNRFKKEDVKYNLFNRNCATWVNGILSAAGISSDERKKKGEFNGIDWGEESDALYGYFRE